MLLCTLSDHDFVCLELVFDDFSNHRSGVWKFNVNPLSDPNFWESISALISNQKTKIASFPCLGDWWDNLKVLIRKQCMDFSIRKRRALNHSRNMITKQLIRAKRAFHTSASCNNSEIKSL